MPIPARNVLRAWPGATLLAVALSCAIPPPTAQAAVLATATINFPSTLSPGQTDVAASIEVTNANTGAEAAATDTVTSILLTPSCAAAGPTGCPAASVDPGVFSLSTFGTGEVGTACAGITFSISEVDAASGRLQFTPGAPVLLSGVGATCTINFTLNVLKVPTKDASASPGTQTLPVLDVTLTAAAGSTTPRATTFTTVQFSQQICADIDGDGRIDALTDALILLRALFGLTGTTVTNGALGASATRTTWDQVRIHMNTYCGTNLIP